MIINKWVIEPVPNVGSTPTASAPRGRKDREIQPASPRPARPVRRLQALLLPGLRRPLAEGSPRCAGAEPGGRQLPVMTPPAKAGGFSGLNAPLWLYCFRHGYSLPFRVNGSLVVFL